MMSSPDEARDTQAYQPALSPSEETNGVHPNQRSTEPDVVELATPSALPPLWRRLLAFVAILIGGVCGALIGFGFGDITCSSDSCATATGSFTLLGAILGAGGVAIVAILALRAMDEWESVGAERARLAKRQRSR